MITRGPNILPIVEIQNKQFGWNHVQNKCLLPFQSVFTAIGFNPKPGNELKSC